MVTLDSNLPLWEVTVAPCCRLYDMKTLKIRGCEARRLAEIALFERIQSEFNIYPSQISQEVRYLAARDDQSLQQTFEVMRSSSVYEFNLFFSGLLILEKGQTLTVISNRTYYSNGIRKQFNLYERKFWKSFAKKTIAEGVARREALLALRSATMEVLDWAFNQLQIISTE